MFLKVHRGLYSVSQRLQLITYLKRTMSSEGRLNGREVNIPVPWGVIAGKEWGDPNGIPWIGLHGWMDNAGTFDPLAKTFPQGHRLVCIDYPGHGLSSHLPKGALYHFLESQIYIQRIANHFGWKKFSLIGHSMGGGMGCLFSGTFPEQVQALIMLDLIIPMPRPQETLVDRTKDAVNQALLMEKKSEETAPKAYTTYESMLERLLAGNALANDGPSVSIESAKIMLKRGMKPNPDGHGYVFNRDMRHMIKGLYGFPVSSIKEFASNITSPHLIVKASEGPLYSLKQEDMDEMIALYSNNPKFEYEVVEGKHHVHMCHPDRVEPIITRFIEKHFNRTEQKEEVLKEEMMS